MIKAIPKLILRPVFKLLNSIYAGNYYRQGLKSLGSRLDDLEAGEDILVLARRLNDETIGMGGTLLMAREDDSEKSLVYFSGSRGEESDRLVETYGIDQVYYLEEAEKKISRENEELVEKIYQILVKKTPKRIYTPFLLDGRKENIELTRVLLQAIERWDKDFDNIWMYEINTPNDLRLINRVNSLTREVYKEKLELYKMLEKANANDFDANALMDRKKGLLVDEDTFAAETFIKLDYETARRAESILEEEDFNPEDFPALTSQFNLIAAFTKNKKMKVHYNNNLNFVIKNMALEGEKK